MAIVQISRITHRKGLMENLPQLAGGEFGWALDEQRLWIGNGTLADGAPIIGNTEILTQHSDILGLSSTYTFKGEVENPHNSEFRALPPAQTGVTVNSPVYRSLQARLDDIVSVKGFGAVGDGVTDDTEALNRALYELFCVSVNEETRRGLFLPAGVYKVSGTIKIPPFAKILGEGIDSSVIQYISSDVTPDAYVVSTADSLQQTDANIGENGAIAPTGIEVSSLTIKTNNSNSILSVNRTTQSYFDSVKLEGNLEVADLVSAVHNTKAIEIESSANYETSQITFSKCQARNCTFGFFSKYNCSGITFESGQFNTLYKGVTLGYENETVNGGPQGVRITQNLFDNIAAEGIEITESGYNVSGFNIFLEVGNGFNGLENPITPNINFKNSNNMSYGDVFKRDDIRDAEVPRVTLNDTSSIAFDGTYQLKFGQFHKTIGLDTIVANGTTIPETIFSLSNLDYKGFELHYCIRRGDDIRTGKLISTAGYGSVPITYTDEFTESNDVGVILTVTQTGAGVIELKCQTSSSGEDTLLTYTIDKFVTGPALAPPPPPPPPAPPLAIVVSDESWSSFGGSELLANLISVTDGTPPYTNFNVELISATGGTGLGGELEVDGTVINVGESVDVSNAFVIVRSPFALANTIDFEVRVTVTDSNTQTANDTGIWTILGGS